jgi:hypothetical protein
MAYDLPEELRDDSSRELEAQAADLAAQAAAENLALEREHSESMQLETEISNAMDDFFDMSFDDVEDRPCSSQGADVDVSVIPGYSAENTFGFARVALQPEGVKHFWETGFWNDFTRTRVFSVRLIATSRGLLTTPLTDLQERQLRLLNENPKH